MADEHNSPFSLPLEVIARALGPRALARLSSTCKALREEHLAHVRSLALVLDIRAVQALGADAHACFPEDVARVATLRSLLRRRGPALRELTLAMTNSDGSFTRGMLLPTAAVRLGEGWGGHLRRLHMAASLTPALLEEISRTFPGLTHLRVAECASCADTAQWSVALAGLPLTLQHLDLPALPRSVEAWAAAHLPALRRLHLGIMGPTTLPDVCSSGSGIRTLLVVRTWAPWPLGCAATGSGRAWQHATSRACATKSNTRSSGSPSCCRACPTSLRCRLTA